MSPCTVSSRPYRLTFHIVVWVKECEILQATSQEGEEERPVTSIERRVKLWRQRSVTEGILLSRGVQGKKTTSDSQLKRRSESRKFLFWRDNLRSAFEKQVVLDLVIDSS